MNATVPTKISALYNKSLYEKLFFFFQCSITLEFFAKNNKVMISSCGINHVLTDNEKMGLAEITKAWIKFTDKK